MKHRIVMMLVSAMLVSAARAQPTHLAAPLAGLQFLVGDWASGDGKVADTGGTSSGRSHITVAAGGAALLREDHTELRDAHGKPTGGFDQIMLIYAEGLAIHADYTDGSHVIHYRSVTVVPGRSVIFASEAGAGAMAPTFRLTYERAAPDTLAITFGMMPPGSSSLRPIAAGTLHRAR